MAAVPRSLAAVLIALAAVFWVVTLAGVAGLDARCTGGCRALYGLSYWVVFYELLVLALVALATMSGSHVHRPLLLALLASVATLAMLQTDRYVSFKNAQQLPGSDLGERLNTAIAGFVVLAILDLALMFLIGFSFSWEDQADEMPGKGTLPAGAALPPMAPRRAPPPAAGTGAGAGAPAPAAAGGAPMAGTTGQWTTTPPVPTNV